MAFAQLPAYPEFDTKSEGVATRWHKWVSRLTNNLFVAYHVTDESRKKALLLTYAGNDLNDIVESLPDSETTPTPDESVFDKLIQSLNSYFNPKVNKEIQRYAFRQLHQQTDEIETFYTELKQLAPSCEFHSPDEEIKSQLIAGCKSSKVREKGLNNPNILLTDLLQFARTCEITQKHAKQVEGNNSSLHKIRSTPSSTNNSQPKQNRVPTSKCKNCGRAWPHEGGQKYCPAFNKQCRACGKNNHFAIVCNSAARPAFQPKRTTHQKQLFNKHVRNVNDTLEENYVFMSTTQSTCLPLFDVTINGSMIQVLADSGASINILPEHVFKKLTPKPHLNSSKTKIFPFSSSQPLDVIGKFNASISHKNIDISADFLVVKTKEIPIIGWKTCLELQLLQKVTAVSNCEISAQFPDIFTGLGKLKDHSVKLHIDETVLPVAQRYRRIPFHMRKQLENYLKKEESMGVIEKATGATPWVSPIVIVPKPKSPDQIRVCVDMRAPNTAIKRERHNMPTLDELSTTLSGSKVFSKLDLNQGYNQIELDEESRYITTFATHKGLYRFKRLSFGVNSAAEIFQESIRQALNGLNGVINFSDDILVYGRNKADHDSNLKNVFQRLREKNLTLNANKCKFRQDSIEFLGHIFTAEGMNPCPNKLQDIINIQPPKTISEVRSLIGMMNFCGSRFVPDYATLTHDLRQLTQKNSVFKWTRKHDKILQTLKEKLKTSANLAYFDPSKETQIFVDASPVGISAILTQSIQNQHPQTVQYASRALTPTEQRYSQTEREALAVTWSCEHFHIYLYGSPLFTIYTDHKPLVTLFGNPKTQLPARIERWVMRCQAYNMKIKYQIGKDNPADYMSRHPAHHAPSTREEKIAEEYIQYLTDNAIPKAMTLQQVSDETAKDPTLQAVIKSLETGKWYRHTTSVPVEEEELSTEPTVDIPDETTVEPVPAADVDLPNHQLQRPRRTRKMPDRYRDYHMS